MFNAGDRIGPYILIKKLGRGAFGVVWLAERRTALATTRVAIKLPLDAEVSLNSIKQEAELWVQASGHPNVLPIIEANIYDGQIVIVSEYAPDGSLEEWLSQHGGVAPSVEAAVEMVCGILAGLNHLHGRRIIHRDLKPANILLQGQIPRLADFGISRVLQSTSKSSIVVGTPYYMAAEAFDGKRNEQTDIWSVGVIFYQLMSGRLPFPQTDLTSLVGAILTREPEPLPASVPERIREMVARAMHKDRNLRYKTVPEMLADLRRNNRFDTMPYGTAEQTGRIDARQTLPPAVEPPPTVWARPPAEPPPTSLAQMPTQPPARSTSVLNIVLAAVALVALGLAGAVLLYIVPSRTTSSATVNSNTTAQANAKPANTQVTTARPSDTTPSRIPSTNAPPITPLPPTNTAAPQQTDSASEITVALQRWAASLRARDLDAHLSFFTDPLDTYYMRSGYSLDQVRADIAKAFARYTRLDVRVSNIDVTVGASGAEATATFSKAWDFIGEKNFSGHVQQKVWLVKRGGRWLISGIKDL